MILSGEKNNLIVDHQADEGVTRWIAPSDYYLLKFTLHIPTRDRFVEGSLS